MRRGIAPILLAAVAAIVAVAAPAMARPAMRPVIVAHDGENLDACPSIAKALGATAVRAAPGARAPLRDRLRAGAEIYICDYAQGDRWLGVVYAPRGGDAARCGVATPLKGPKPYRGPCRSGWVLGREVKFIAG